VHEPVNPTEVDERPEVHDRADGALAPLPLREILQEGLAALGLRLFQEGAAAEHHVVAIAVELDDLALELGPDERLQVAHPSQIDERRGEEPPQADVQDQAALDDLDHRTLDRLTRLHRLFDLAPGALVLGPLLGQDQAAFLVLLLENQRLHVLADLNDLGRLHVVADRQLLGRDHALGLVADVEQHLVAVDLDHVPLDDVSVLEVAERRLHRRDQLVGGQVGLRSGCRGRLGDRRLITHAVVLLAGTRGSPLAALDLRAAQEPCDQAGW
jgi:hypothetical protein